MATRPITDTLRLLDGGAFLDRCSDELAKLVRAVDETGKGGTLKLELAVKRGTKGAMLIQPNVTAKVPEPKPDATMLWATTEGNLVLDNPKQQKLDLRQVDPATGEIRTVPADPAKTELRTA